MIDPRIRFLYYYFLKRSVLYYLNDLKMFEAIDNHMITSKGNLKEIKDKVLKELVDEQN